MRRGATYFNLEPAANAMNKMRGMIILSTVREITLPYDLNRLEVSISSSSWREGM